MADFDHHISHRGRLMKKLRRWNIIYTILLVLLLSSNIYLSLKLVSITKDKTVNTIDMMKDTIVEMKGMNDKAVMVLKEVNNLVKQNEEDLYRNMLAGFMLDYLTDISVKASYFNIVKIIECSQKYAELPFTYVDLITLAWIESHFDPYCLGKHGEEGVWQVLDWERELKKVKGKSPNDIETNCKMAVNVLKDKYLHRKTVKNSIIAYNGWVVTDGVVSQKYYKIYLERKKIIENLCKKAERKMKRLGK